MPTQAFTRGFILVTRIWHMLNRDLKIIGYTDLPGRLPTQSSQLYGTNLVNLLKLLCKEKDGNVTVDFDDVVVRGVTVVRDGEITWPAPPIQVSAQPQAAQKAAPEVKTEEKCACSPWRKYALMALAIILFGWMASVAPKEFLGHFTVFALACVVDATDSGTPDFRLGSASKGETGMAATLMVAG